MATTTRRRRYSDEERAAARERERELVQRSVEALRSTEGWQNWLRSRSRFTRYSLGNQLLIAIQAQEMLEAGYIERMPVRVAGFQTWLKLGYCVQKRPESVPKGAWSIRIWAHCDPSKKAREAALAAGEPTPRGFFTLVTVYPDCVVQPLADFPNPVALYPPMADIQGDDLGYVWEPLCAYCDSLDVPVSIAGAMAADGALTIHSGIPKSIAIRESQSVNSRVAALLHEMAHMLVRVDRQDDDPDLSELGYAGEELVVESVAMSVCGTLGLDTSANSIPYLTSWSERCDIKVLQATAALTDRLCRRLESVIPSQLDGEEVA